MAVIDLPTRETWRYHAEYAPEGQIFDLNKVSDTDLVAQGWVDNPAKIGNNMWGREDLDGPVQHTRDQLKNGDIDPVDKESRPAHGSQEENERHQIERDRLYGELRTKDETIAYLQRQLREGKERDADIRSDAAKSGQQSPAEMVAGAPKEARTTIPQSEIPKYTEGETREDQPDQKDSAGGTGEGDGTQAPTPPEAPATPESDVKEGDANTEL